MLVSKFWQLKTCWLNVVVRVCSFKCLCISMINFSHCWFQFKLHKWNFHFLCSFSFWTIPRTESADDLYVNRCNRCQQVNSLANFPFFGLWIQPVTNTHTHNMASLDHFEWEKKSFFVPQIMLKEWNICRLNESTFSQV